MARNGDSCGEKPTRDDPKDRVQRSLLAAHRDLAEALLALQSRPEWRRAIEATQRPSEDMRRLVEQAQRLAEPLRQMMEATQQFSEPIRQIAQRFSEPIRQMVEAAPRLSEQIQQMMEVAARSEPFMRWWEDFERQYGLAQEQAAPVLRRYKWSVTPSLPFAFVFYVVREGRKRGRRDKDINALFVDYFATDGWQALQAMVDRWEDKPLLKKRMRVLRDCVKAMQAAERVRFNAANVVLPTLIAQIDGALTDYLESKGVPRYTGYDRKKSEFQKLKNGLLRGPLEEVASFVFLDVLFQSTRHRQGPQIPLGFSRHRVIHGENIHYGRKDYVIRAFLALDYLAYLD